MFALFLYQIERWWRELHERLEKFFKLPLKELQDQGHYDTNSETDRLLLAYIMIPIVQREVNTFVDVVWNCHRIREQRDSFLPDGVPNHIYSFPDKYGLEDCGRYLCDFFVNRVLLLISVRIPSKKIAQGQ